MRWMRALGKSLASVSSTRCVPVPEKRIAGIFAFLVRANQRNFFDVAADVAGEFLFLPVKREREAAIRAIANVTALRALQRSRVAAPVQK
jgi:hypothetical protein